MNPKQTQMGNKHLVLCYTLRTFNNDSFDMRVVNDEHGEPWFCLTDVCKALGLQVQATKVRLKEDGVSSTNTIDNLGKRFKKSAISTTEVRSYTHSMRLVSIQSTSGLIQFNLRG